MTPVVLETTGDNTYNSVLDNKPEENIVFRNQILATNFFGWDDIEGDHSREEDLRMANKRYYTGDERYRRNCQRCVIAYEARRRGYNVIAKPRILDGTDSLPFLNADTGWPSVFKNSILTDVGANSSEKCRILIEEEMKNWGNGARAIVAVRYSFGGAHVFIAENVDDSIVFCDPQTGNTNIESIFDLIIPQTTYLMRMDNLDFSERAADCCEVHI